MILLYPQIFMLAVSFKYSIHDCNLISGDVHLQCGFVFLTESVMEYHSSRIHTNRLPDMGNDAMGFGNG